MNRAIHAGVMNRPQESVAAFEALIARSAWAAELMSAWAQYSLPLFMIGEHERALEAARRAYELDPEGGNFGPAFVLNFQVAPLAALGRVEELNALIGKLAALPDRGGARHFLPEIVAYLRAYGHDAAAREAGEQVMEWFAVTPTDVAAAPYHRDRYFRVLFHAGFLDEAREVVDSIIQDFPDEIDPRVYRLLVETLRGDSVQVRRDGEWLEDHEGWLSAAVRRAAVASALGDLEGAVNLLREADLNLSRLDRRSMWYVHLRGYEPFEELVAPKG